MDPIKEKKLLSLGILEILMEDEKIVNENYLKLALAVDLTISVTYTDLRNELQQLEKSRQIHAISSQDKGVLYSIADAGRARILEIHG